MINDSIHKLLNKHFFIKRLNYALRRNLIEVQEIDLLDQIFKNNRSYVKSMTS